MLYVLGGCPNDCSQFTKKVYYSRINADGSLAGWNETTPLPQPLAYFCAVGAGGRLFVMGGDNDSAPVNVFYGAAVAGDGALGIWSSGPALPQSMFESGAAITDSYIFLTGGTQDGVFGFNGVYSLALPPLPTTPILALQRFGTNGALQLQLTSTTNTGFGLLASTNLTTWTNIGSGFTGTNGSLLWQDTNAANFSNRFYRAYWPLP